MIQYSVEVHDVDVVVVLMFAFAMYGFVFSLFSFVS